MKMNELAAAPARSLNQLLRARRATRAFRSDPVPKTVLDEILATASLSASTFNTQPWKVHVIRGDALAGVSNAILEADRQGTHPPFSPFPNPPVEACAARQAEFGRQYYASLGIDRNDMPARARQTARNYQFFGAPVGLMLTIDARLTRHSWLDMGLFLQSLMLAAAERGLSTCPQVAFVRYESVIARYLGFDSTEALACGVSIGYADQDAPVNRFSLPRASLMEFVQRHEG